MAYVGLKNNRKAKPGDRITLKFYDKSKDSAKLTSKHLSHGGGIVLEVKNRLEGSTTITCQYLVRCNCGTESWIRAMAFNREK